MGHNSLTLVKQLMLSTEAMHHSSSIATTIRTQIWMCFRKVKGHPGITIWTTIVDCFPAVIYHSQPQNFIGSGEGESSMIYTKIHPQSFLGFHQKIFFFLLLLLLLLLLPYLGTAAILFNSGEPFEHIVNIDITIWTNRQYRQKAPCDICWKLVKKGLEKSPGSATITNRSPSQTPRGRGNRQIQTSTNRTNVWKALR